MNEGVGRRDRWAGRLKRLLRAAGVDQAVFFAVAVRVWQILAGPVTALLIALKFSPEVQGVYYTFSSLLAMQAVAELGLHWVVIHAASHEWASLELDSDGGVQGEQQAHSRLAELTGRATRWFAAVSLLYIAVAGMVGTVFFSRQAVTVHWQLPWIATCLLAGMSLAISPRIAVLEGCGQMRVVNRVRWQQVASGHVLVWSAIVLGLELWVAVAAAAARVAWEVWLVWGRYGRFWPTLYGAARTAEFDWRREIWPLQWRAAVQAPFLFLAQQLFTPIMFHYHGAAVAGAMGMTWTILQVLQQGALAWPQSHAPEFGMLVVRGERHRLDRLFARIVLVSSGALLAGTSMFCIFVALLPAVEHSMASRLAERLLPPPATFAFALALFLGYLAQCLNIYLRSHRQAPLFWLSLLTNSLIAASAWVAGARGGPVAAGLALLIITALLRLPGSFIIWRHFRRTWPGEAKP